MDRVPEGIRKEKVQNGCDAQPDDRQRVSYRHEPQQCALSAVRLGSMI